MARVVALVYAGIVVAVLCLSLWPQAQGWGGLLAVILSLPWGLVVMLALDTIDPFLVLVLGPPLIAISGLFNALLIYRALRHPAGAG